jgi:lantibiotic modifying enzyme
MGNVELLLQASQMSWSSDAHERLAAFSRYILRSIKEHGWRCGVPFGLETPGLMTGLAGIGYGLLRLAEPQRVPSVLLLEPPRS